MTEHFFMKHFCIKQFWFLQALSRVFEDRIQTSSLPKRARSAEHLVLEHPAVLS